MTTFTCNNCAIGPCKWTCNNLSKDQHGYDCPVCAIELTARWKPVEESNIPAVAVKVTIKHTHCISKINNEKKDIIDYIMDYDSW